jgi:hypothetical protein
MVEIMRFSDLARKAALRRVHLPDAYRALGLNYSTFWRHATGRSQPQRRTALMLSDAIEKMDNGGRFKEAWRAQLRCEFIILRRHRRMTQGEVEDGIGLTSALVAKYEANMRTPNAFILCCWGDMIGGRLMLIPNEVVEPVSQIVEAFYAGR